MPFQKVQIVENISKDSDLKRTVNPMKETISSAGGPPTLQAAQAAIQKALEPEIRRREVTMSDRPEGLVVSRREMGLFESGSAGVRPESPDAISRRAYVLKTAPQNLRIEGHTDDIPIPASCFSSNWELSTSRATNLIKPRIVNYGIPPSHLSAAGYGEKLSSAGCRAAFCRAPAQSEASGD